MNPTLAEFRQQPINLLRELVPTTNENFIRHSHGRPAGMMGCAEKSRKRSVSIVRELIELLTLIPKSSSYSSTEMFIRLLAKIEGIWTWNNRPREILSASRCCLSIFDYWLNWPENLTFNLMWIKKRHPKKCVMRNNITKRKASGRLKKFRFLNAH